MSSTQPGMWLNLFQAAQSTSLPLRAQLCTALREAIRSGAVPYPARLPASRTLAADLGISRVTVEAAYGQLEAEGYLTRRVGQGSFVAARFARPVEAEQPLRGSQLAALSQRGHQLVRGGGCRDPRTPLAFAAGSPDLRAFPHDTWRQLCNQRLRRDAATLAAYGDPQGYAPLRAAIAAYLQQARDVRAGAEQVLVLTSSQQALHLLGSLLLDEGDVVWLEEPGYRGARTALAAAGARLVAVPVDGEGMCPGDDLPPPRLIYLTPSHQYPSGCALSLTRRLALLEIARKHGSWIIEDDYDSEFHYDGRPLPAMQGLDRHERVIYLGTFSKALFPSLRLAYAVLPPALVEPACTVRTIYDGHGSQLMQAVTADFIARGHFAAHLRYMRQLYRSRRALLIEELDAKLPHLLRVQPSPGGLQLLVELPPGSEAHLTRQAQALGVATPSLRSLYLAEPGRDGWLLGFAALSAEEIRLGVRQLQVLRI
ncbi:PLP-dependent aminotransferase family protein [Chitinimonas arctica]|uniref:Putative 8-amino-7-oxononanoate synthase n=1 Tax=Chitinimonas arctica TaxID=2594795 RepID=A0A516SDL8_9NEIS|nr:PLP-dependent aminotransferase family protein [Chitinimonas arctica]QDQ26253.1 PLP-dependent aminotransferase family protein [Chitinimonas arctica]